MTPELNAAADARMLAALQARRAGKLRGDSLASARELVRKAGIRDDAELLQALQNIHAAAVQCEYADLLLNLITDIDGDLNHPAEPEVLEYRSERGEFDSFTQGVRHRG